MKSRKSSLFSSFILLNTATFGGLHILNRMIRKQAVSSDLLKEGVGQFYPWKYGNVFYRVSGQGNTPLVLLHDLTESSSAYEWHTVTRSLGEAYRIYTIDLPGCGRSDKPAMEYTNFVYVSFLTDFIDNVIGEPAVLAGSHFSSYLPLMTAVYKPELVSRIVMINPPTPEYYAKVPSVKDVIRRKLLFFPVLGECLYNLLTARRNIAHELRDHVFFNSLLVSQKMTAVFYEAAHKGEGSGRYLRSSLDGGLLNWNLEHALKTVTTETDIIYGRNWPEFEKSRAAYRKRNDRFRIQTVSSSGTLPHMENPKDFCRILL